MDSFSYYRFLGCLRWKVVISEEATHHTEREQINKSIWLINISRAHFIGRDLFPIHHFLGFNF